jgi:hypothetical protein
MKIIEKIAIDIKITDEEIAIELNEICQSIHSTCDSDCPVYRMAGNKMPHGGGCECFGNGKMMLEYIRSKGVFKWPCIEGNSDM